MTARTCDQCGKHLVTHRRGARFCSEDCKNAWHNKQRLGQGTTDKRLTSLNGGEGSRGGNVRSVQEARDLQAQQKDKRDWAGAIDEQIRRTLIETGYFHADDLDALGVPPEHCNLKGTRAAWFRNQKLMESTDVYRKVSHAAANGRKAPIYRVTAKGRAKLAGVGGAASQPSPHSGEKPSEVGAGVPDRQGSGGASSSPSSVGDSSDGCVSGSVSPDTPPEPLTLLPEPPAMFDPDQRAA